MITNEAPEKIYCGNNGHGNLSYSNQMFPNVFEYTRNDAFIEKACEYMRNHIDKQLTIYHENTWKKRDEFIRDFKKYMKGK